MKPEMIYISASVIFQATIKTKLGLPMEICLLAIIWYIYIFFVKCTLVYIVPLPSTMAAPHQSKRLFSKRQKENEYVSFYRRDS